MYSDYLIKSIGNYIMSIAYELMTSISISFLSKSSSIVPKEVIQWRFPKKKEAIQWLFDKALDQLNED